MTIQQKLLNAGCEIDVVYYNNPRGFVNESGILPIPHEFRSEAELLVEVRQAMHEGQGTCDLIPVGSLSALQRTRVLHLLNEDVDLRGVWIDECEILQ